MLRHFRVLRNPSYALYFFGQLLSMTGTWIQATVQAWLIYKLSHSAEWLGVITFCTQVPAFLLSPLAGLIADLKDRRKLLITTQIVAMIQALLFSVLVFTHHITLFQIALLSTFLGATNAFDMTTRHAFSVDMVGKTDLSSAIALNSFIINSARILGPALAGVLIVLVGEGWCFFLNALSYLAVIYGLVAMRLEPRKIAMESRNPLEHLRDGINYVKNNKHIEGLLGIGAFTALIGFQYTVLLPVIAKDVLHGDAHTFGWLSSLNGVGAILGGLSIISTHEEPANTRKRLITRILFLGFALLVMGLSRNLILTFIAMVFTGYFMMSIFPTINSSIQMVVEDSKRGRVLSLYTMSFLGTTPIGGLLAGWLAHRLGTPFVIWFSGLMCISFSLAVSVKRPNPAS